MLYSALITDLRREVKDYKRKAEDLFDGDGSTAVFVGSHSPIIEDSQQVLVGGSLKTEVTHYTIDDDLNELEFTSGNEPASGSDNVKNTYRYASLTDTDWMRAINAGIEYFGKKFWTEILDNTTHDTVKDQYEYDLSSITNGNLIFKIIAAHFRTSSSGDWISFESATNLRFFEDRSRAWVNPAFQISDYDIQWRALRRPATSTTTSDTVDVENDEIEAIKAYAKYQYYLALSARRAMDDTAASTDRTTTPSSVLLRIAKENLADADRIASRVKKNMPSTSIPNTKWGITT